MTKTKEEKKQERIAEIRACALGIADEAEKIYGDYEFPCDLKIVISFELTKGPSVSVERAFVPNKLVEYYTHK